MLGGLATRTGKAVAACVPCLFVMVVFSAGAAPPEMLTFNGICDASAGVALDENRIIVGDDEQPWLSVYGLAGGDSVCRIPLPGRPASAGDAEPEADLEGATVFDGRIVWISSNGRNKNGKVRPERFRLFASHRMIADQPEWREDFSPSFGGLPEAIAATTGKITSRCANPSGTCKRPTRAWRRRSTASTSRA
jgi:hypothetical protein